MNAMENSAVLDASRYTQSGSHHGRRPYNELTQCPMETEFHDRHFARVYASRFRFRCFVRLRWEGGILDGRYGSGVTSMPVHTAMRN